MKNLWLLLLAGAFALAPMRVSGMIPRKETEKRRDEEHRDKKLDRTGARTDKEQIAAAKKAALQGSGNPDAENNKEIVEEENLFNPTTLEQRIQEAQKVVTDLEGKGPAMEEIALLNLYQLWSERSEYYKQAEADLSKQTNNNDSDNERELIETKLKELVEASQMVIEALEQPLSNFALEEMRRSSPFSVSLQASDSEKEQIENALRAKIIMTPQQQEEELKQYYEENETQFGKAQQLWREHISALLNREEVREILNRCLNWFTKQEEASATEGLLTKGIKGVAAVAGEIAGPVSNVPEFHAQTAGLALGLISSGLNWASTLPAKTSRKWRETLLKVNSQAHSEADSAVSKATDLAGIAENEAEEEAKRLKKEREKKTISDAKEWYDLFSNADKKTPQEWAEQLLQKINLPETFKTLLVTQHPDTFVALGGQLWLERKKASRELFCNQQRAVQPKIEVLETAAASSLKQFKLTQEMHRLKINELEKSQERKQMSTADYEGHQNRYNSTCLQLLTLKENRIKLTLMRKLLGTTQAELKQANKEQSWAQQQVDFFQTALDKDTKTAWNDMQTYSFTTETLEHSLKPFQFAAEAHQVAWERIWKNFSSSKEWIQARASHLRAQQAWDEAIRTTIASYVRATQASDKAQDVTRPKWYKERYYYEECEQKLTNSNQSITVSDGFLDEELQSLLLNWKKAIKPTEEAHSSWRDWNFLHSLNSPDKEEASKVCVEQARRAEKKWFSQSQGAKINYSKTAYRIAYLNVEKLHAPEIQSFFSGPTTRQKQEAIDDYAKKTITLFNLQSQSKAEKRKYRYEKIALPLEEQEQLEATIRAREKKAQENYLPRLRLTPQEKEKEIELLRKAHDKKDYYYGYTEGGYDDAINAKRDAIRAEGKGELETALFWNEAAKQYQFIADYWRQKVQVWSNYYCDEVIRESGSNLEDSIKNYKKAIEAESKGKLEIAAFWNESAKQYQLIADYYRQNAEAKLKGDSKKIGHFEEFKLKYANEAAQNSAQKLYFAVKAQEEALQAQAERKVEVAALLNEKAKQNQLAAIYWCQSMEATQLGVNYYCQKMEAFSRWHFQSSESFKEASDIAYEIGKIFETIAKEVQVKAIQFKTEGRQEVEACCKKVIEQYQLAADYWRQSMEVTLQSDPEKAKRLRTNAWAVQNNSWGLWEVVQAQEKAISANSRTDEKATPLFKKFFTKRVEQYQLAADYYRQSMEAILQDDLEKGKRFYRVATTIIDAEQVKSYRLPWTILTLEGKPEIAEISNKGFNQYQRAADYYYQKMEAVLQGRLEKAERFENAAKAAKESGWKLDSAAKTLKEALEAEAQGTQTEKAASLKKSATQYQRAADYWCQSIEAILQGDLKKTESLKTAANTAEEKADAIKREISWRLFLR